MATGDDMVLENSSPVLYASMHSWNGMEFELTSVPSVCACVCDLSVGWLVWRPARLQAMNVSGTYLEAWDGVRSTYEQGLSLQPHKHRTYDTLHRPRRKGEEC